MQLDDCTLSVLLNERHSASCRYIGKTTCVGFVAAAVSMPMGGCRARRPVDGRSLVSAGTVDVVMAAEPAVL